MPTINDYRFESVRLDSYKILPYLWKVEPQKLAAAGFYYTGESDQVQCFMCDVKLCNWEPKDDPFADHQRESSKCEFIRNIPCGNVPIGTDPSTIPIPVVNKRIDVPNRLFEFPTFAIHFNQSSENQNTIERRTYWLEQLVGRNLIKFKYSLCSEYTIRLATYKKWPKSKSQAKKLAAAGFCYSGNSDQTICYYCHGRLKNWEPNDDPWAEHAKWFHYCHHLIISKGTEFINNITGTSYIKISTLNDTMEEKCEELDTSENIDSGSSQNIITAKEPNTEVSSVSHEASSEEQCDQGLKDINLSDNTGKDTVN